jgi:hypothetical protein
MRLETIAHSRLDARTTPNTAKMTRMKLMASMVCERGGGGCGEGWKYGTAAEKRRVGEELGDCSTQWWGMESAFACSFIAG